MKTSRPVLLLLVALLLIGVACGAFRLGQRQAHREALRNLAFVSLWTVKPAMQAVDLAMAQPGSVPDAVLFAADSAIQMVARQSTTFDPDLSKLHVDAQIILCALAKNREMYRSRQPDLYDEPLMRHLAQVHATLAPSAKQETRTLTLSTGCAI